MAFTAEDVQNLMAAIDGALASGRLNTWQMKFVIDVRGKLDRYGTKTHLSGRQASKLREILSGKRRFHVRRYLFRRRGRSGSALDRMEALLTVLSLAFGAMLVVMICSQI